MIHSQSLRRPLRLWSTSTAPASVCAEACSQAPRCPVRGAWWAASGPHRALAQVPCFAACTGPTGPVERDVAYLVQTRSCQCRPGATFCRVLACRACGGPASLKYSNRPHG